MKEKLVYAPNGNAVGDHHSQVAIVIVAMILLWILGFAFFIKSSGATFQCSTLDGLKSSCQAAARGDTILVSGTINCTGGTVIIPAGVVLYGGRSSSNNGALLYSTSFTPVTGGLPLIQTGGPDVTISGLRLRGATGEITDFDYRRGVSKGIHGNHPRLTVTGCEIYWFDMWGVYLYAPEGAVIRDNYIHNCRNAGYGYGVWVGGSGTKFEGTATITRNIFDACRSAVDGSGHYSDMVITDNVFLPEQHYTVISRHGQSNGCKGGNSFTATGNIVTSDQRAFTIPDPATDTGRVVVSGNRVRNSLRSLVGCNRPDTSSEHWSNPGEVVVNWR